MREPDQARRQSLADLAKVITEAEKDRDQRREELRHAKATGHDERVTQMRLALAEERLAQLHRSREVLRRGEQAPHADDKAS